MRRKELRPIDDTIIVGVHLFVQLVHDTVCTILHRHFSQVLIVRPALKESIYPARLRYKMTTLGCILALAGSARLKELK
jgi:hypothetical protein